VYFWLRNRRAADLMAERFRPIYTFFLNKWYFDEVYDAVIVQPTKVISTGPLWKGVDAGLIDGTVNGVGAVVSATSSALRRLQTGSVRTYAFALFAGAVVILGYYLAR
jgi:NADH-quinone oxidoreductase subunit L